MFARPLIETSAPAKANKFKRDHQSSARNDLASRPKLRLDFDIKIRVSFRPKFSVANSITLHSKGRSLR